MPLLTTEDAKSAAYAEIDRQGDEAVRISKKVLAEPEPGYREHKTSGIVASEFRRMVIPFQEGIAITGIKGILDSGRPGPTIAVMGELDSHIVNPESTEGGRRVSVLRRQEGAPVLLG